MTEIDIEFPNVGKGNKPKVNYQTNRSRAAPVNVGWQNHKSRKEM